MVAKYNDLAPVSHSPERADGPSMRPCKAVPQRVVDGAKWSWTSELERIIVPPLLSLARDDSTRSPTAMHRSPHLVEQRGCLRVAARAALVLVAAAPCAAPAQTGEAGENGRPRLRVALRAEQLRLGRHVDGFVDSPMTWGGDDRVGTHRQVLTLDAAPASGAGAELAFTLPGRGWGLVASGGYGRGQIQTRAAAYLWSPSIDSTFNLPPTAPPGHLMEETTFERRVTTWRFGLGVVRDLTSRTSRVGGFVTAGGAVTALRIPFATAGAPLPPSFGYGGYAAAPERTKTYLAPGVDGGAGLTVALWRGVALELRATAGAHRVDPDRLARDFDAAAQAVFGVSAGAQRAGLVQWRRVTMLGAGLAYGFGGS